jgi:hypothetical protein
MLYEEFIQDQARASQLAFAGDRHWSEPLLTHPEEITNRAYAYFVLASRQIRPRRNDGAEIPFGQMPTDMLRKHINFYR